jgi:ascorbate-specific PTS system EIIC-type component UlaA
MKTAFRGTSAMDFLELKEAELCVLKARVMCGMFERRSAMRSSVTLGATYRDKITGFKGVCTGHCQYISGCSQALLAPKIGKDGNAKAAEWFDVQRLDRVKSEIITLDNQQTPGADVPAPIR